MRSLVGLCLGGEIPYIELFYAFLLASSLA
jgi:hypothetical protein